jgi:hypothetical protein
MCPPRNRTTFIRNIFLYLMRNERVISGDQDEWETLYMAHCLLHINIRTEYNKHLIAYSMKQLRLNYKQITKAVEEYRPPSSVPAPARLCMIVCLYSQVTTAQSPLNRPV